MLDMVVSLVDGWKSVFEQERTAARAIRQAISSVCVVGQRTIARSILVREPVAQPPPQGGAPSAGAGARPVPAADWSAEYRLHARSAWDAQRLFDPVLKQTIALCPGDLLPVAFDDTLVRKSGATISQAQWLRDPLSPPFHVNLTRGLRFVHGAVLLPLHQTHQQPACAVPVCFELAPALKKPGAKATDEERAAYRTAKKRQNLSTRAVEIFGSVRQRVDAVGGQQRTILAALDGSYCNKTVFKARLERFELIARTRKDAVLCWPSSEKRRTYDPTTFTPEQVRGDDRIPWQTGRVFVGGTWRQTEYKEVSGVLWRTGGGPRRLRLFVIKPVPYRTTKNGRLMYRRAAYLVCTDLKREAEALLQVYFDRWQIEPVHRNLKQEFGLGQAQVRNPKSVARQPALTVATYSVLRMAALLSYGPGRPELFGPVPRWQREKTHPSCQDLVRHVRAEVVSKPWLVARFGLTLTPEAILAAATL